MASPSNHDWQARARSGIAGWWIGAKAFRVRPRHVDLRFDRTESG